MKVTLDENLPADAVAVVRQFGHDVETVTEGGLGGASDDLVTSAARREGRFLITLDRGMADIRTYPPGSHPGIAVLRPPHQRAEAVVNTLRMFLMRHDLDELAHCTVVVRGPVVRIRRPPTRSSADGADGPSSVAAAHTGRP